MSNHVIVSGFEHLRRADWPRAKATFEEVLRNAASPEAHDGLGIALWWLNDIDDCHRHRVAAFAGYKACGETGKAARIACWLGREQVFLHGSPAAMTGWFARADSLPRCEGDAADRGWCALYQASMTSSPAVLESIALHAVDTGRKHASPALESVALAFAGMAAVSLGNIETGLRRLDEAMTMFTGGEVDDLMAASEIFCLMLSACETAGDLARSEYWCRVAADFAERNQCAFLSAYCRTTYGSLLMATGRIQDAELSLLEAIRGFDDGHRGLRVHAVLKLAELRIVQGRLEEAELLLTGLEDYGAAQLPRARLHLARGDAPMARAVVQQALAGQSPSLDQLPLLTLLVETLLASGEIDAARKAVRQLETIAETTGSALLIAQAELTRGELQRHTDRDAALASFHAAVSRLREFEPSLLMSRARLAIAQSLVDRDPAAALANATAALAAFERFGATRDAARASVLLQSLGAPRRATVRSPDILTAREQEVLALLAHGLTNREIAARLFISPKTAEHHVGQILAKLGLRTRAEAAAYASKGIGDK